MKIELFISADENSSPIHKVYVDGERKAGIKDLSECPEDAHIGRSLVDGHDIIKFIQMGFEAAKRGEEFVVEYHEDNEE